MFQYTCLNPIAQVGLSVFDGNYAETKQMADADAVLVRSANMHEMELPEKLLAIARAGAGVNNIPLDRCSENGIVVFNTPGANANGVKELVFAGMLFAARDISGGIAWVKSETGNPNIAKLAEKEKKKFAGSELGGKKLGIIGLGAIGVRVANAATHFGMEVYGYDPYISVDAAWNLSRSIHHSKDVNEIYRECDYITIHVPLLESTKGMINEDAISMMKPNAVILNYARDLLVDEDAVLRALKDGKIRRYVTDFPNEKVVGAYGTIVTPHLGASTVESEDNCAVMAAKELRTYLETGNIRNSVNYPNCELGALTTRCRLAIHHQNRKSMIKQFTVLLENENIATMANQSRGDIAYTLFDLDDMVSDEVVEKISKVEGVYRIRRIV